MKFLINWNRTHPLPKFFISHCTDSVARYKCPSVISVPCPNSLTRLVLPKINQKCQNPQLNSQDLAIFVKSKSGSTSWDRKLRIQCYQIGISQSSQILTILLGILAFLINFWQNQSGNTVWTGHWNDGGTLISVASWSNSCQKGNGSLCSFVVWVTVCRWEGLYFYFTIPILIWQQFLIV